MKAFKLEGTSMKPLFKEGEVALVSPLSSSPSAPSSLIPHPSSLDLRPGDCAVYELGGRTLLHRVVGTEEKGAWFSDDSGRLAPHFVPWGRIQGKVVSGNPLKKGLAGRTYSELRRLFYKTAGIFSAKSLSSPF